MKKSVIEDLKNHFNLKTVTIQKWPDKYGTIHGIKELGFEVYAKDFNEAAEELIAAHTFATSEKALSMLKVMQDKDNLFANYFHKREYDIVSVYMTKDFIRFGVTIKFRDNGEFRNVIETSLAHALRSEDNLIDYVNHYPRYFTAGGLRDREVDFLFHGVGHSSTSEMYSRTNEEIFEERR